MRTEDDRRGRAVELTGTETPEEDRAAKERAGGLRRALRTVDRWLGWVGSNCCVNRSADAWDTRRDATQDSPATPTR